MNLVVPGVEAPDVVRRLWATSMALRKLGWEPGQLSYGIDPTDGVYVLTDDESLTPVGVVEGPLDIEVVSAIVTELVSFESLTLRTLKQLLFPLLLQLDAIILLSLQSDRSMILSVSRASFCKANREKML